MSAKTLLHKAIYNLLSEGDVDIQWYPGYSEPGYTDAEYGVLLANWNPKSFACTNSGEVPSIPSRVSHLIEKTGLGYAMEWSDEWSDCGNCGKIVRTNPDNYSWTRSYVIFNDCELVCQKCVTDEMLEEYLMNNVDTADAFGRDWSMRGWVKFDDDFEGGWHCNDSPKNIVKNHVKNDDNFLFQIRNVGQFSMNFILWTRAWDYESE